MTEAKTHHNVAPELKTQIDRILTLMDEDDAIKGDIKECYAALKGMGVDVKAVRVAVKLLRNGADAKAEFDEQVALTEIYYDAVLRAAEKEVL